MLLYHRVGLGLRPEEDIPSDQIGWALGQLTAPLEPVGIRSLRQMAPAIEPWPDKFTYDLDTRVKDSRKMRIGREKLDEDAKLSKADKKIKRRELDKLYRHQEYDSLALFHQAIYGADGVRQRFIHFWMNHFTIGNNSGSQHYAGHLYQEVIAKGVEGKFADLAYDVTRHPAMLTYLDNIYNIGEKSREARDKRDNQIGLNDNLARELMELHTTSPAAAYSEEDIRNAAKILSGWGMIFNNPKAFEWDRKFKIKDYQDAFVKRHAEPGKKTVFGKTYPAGRKALRMLVDDLAAMRETPEFIARRLCTHFISDTPSSDDLAAVIAAWQRSDGHLPTVHQAVIERAALATTPKMQWPLTWFYGLSRLSGSDLIYGWDDVYGKDPHNGVYRPKTIMEEMGQEIWADRQPDGFALEGVNWASPEHMERRIRMAMVMWKFGKIKLDIDEMMARVGASADTRNLIAQTGKTQRKFILLSCCREIMGSV